MKMNRMPMNMLIFAVCLLARSISGKPLLDNSTLDHADILMKLNNLEQKYEELKDQLHREMKRGSEDASEIDPGPSDVYFSANIDQDVRGLVKGDKVVYDYTYNNVGGGYDTSTGVFTAPTAGVYLFSAFCNSLTAQTVTIEMVQNGAYKGSCLVEPAHDGEDEIGGVSFVERLDIGDRVWMELYYTEKGTADLAEHLNTFLGVLIHR